MSRTDRLLRFAGVVALVAIAVVVFTGTARDAGQDEDTRDVACAVAEWNAHITAYFAGSAERLRARLGTPDELSTDQQGLGSLQLLLAASDRLADDLSRPCGPLTTRRS